MNDKTCDLLSEVDNFFTRGTVDEKKFNKFTKCHSYCPYENKCRNDYERINALGSYLFNEIREINKDFKGATSDKRYIEVFMMWLGDKLFKIENDYKITLEEYYKNNLEKFMGNFNYWEAIDSKKLYKRATIKKMNELYNLLSHICKLIIGYNTYIQNPTKNNRNRLGNYSAQCISHYRAIISSANGCQPYLQLLDSLKMIYENFRMYQIDYNNDIKETDKKLLLNRVQHLTRFKGVNQYLLGVTAKPSFDDKECIEVKSKDEQIGEKNLSKKSQKKLKGTEPQKKSSPSTPQGKQTPPAPAKPPAKPPATPRVQPQPKPQPQPVAPIQSTDTQQTGPTAPPPQDGSSLQTPKTGEIHQNGQGGPGDGSGSTGDEKKNINPGLGNHGGSGTQVGTGDGQRSSNTGKGDPVNVPGGGQGSGASDGKGSQGIPSSGASDGQGSQGITSSESGGAGGGPGASKSEQKASDSSKGNKDNGTNDGANGGAGTPGSGDNGGGSTQGDQGNPSVGSSDPASSTSVGSFDWKSSIFEFILKGKEYYNKASEFIKDNQQKFKDAAEKISGAYNDTVENLKSAYNASSGYVNNLINDIIDQFNQTDPPSKQNGNHSGTGNPPGVGNPSNLLPPSQPQNTTDPPTSSKDSSKNTSSDPASNQQPNLLSTPSKDPLPTTPTDPSKGSQPPSPQAPPPATPPGPPKVSSQQIQSPPQPQPITQQPAHVPAQVNQPNSQKIGQLVKSLSSDLILKKPWNIFPTTWNGSGDCKPEIKFMNATLVCCTSEQCSLTGIPVILVLIPIILLIAYKYLSFGSSKKSEKKNMKRVINFHDGNRKTKIIISSYDNKKDLKPVINSVGRKKNSLLNIYKLIRADPMPFINLFFLLIFFVYKRKRDTIE